MEMRNDIWCSAAILCIVYAMSLTTQFYVANAADPNPLQDFCVGVNDINLAVFVNGLFCKNPNDVTINDFVFKGFNVPGDTNNTQGAEATMVNVERFPGLNTLGVSIARVDFAPFGLNVPHHSHPRGSELFSVIEGTFYAGFVTTDNELFDTVLSVGDVMIFPQGLVHFQFNMGNTNALGYVAFGTQNAGRVDVATSVLGTTPRILDDVLTRAFQVNETVIEQLRSQFSSNNISSPNNGRPILKFLTQAS